MIKGEERRDLGLTEHGHELRQDRSGVAASGERLDEQSDVDEIERAFPLCGDGVEEAVLADGEVGREIAFRRCEAGIDVRGFDAGAGEFFGDLHRPEAVACGEFGDAKVWTVRETDPRVDIALVELAPKEVLVAETHGVGGSAPVGVFVPTSCHSIEAECGRSRLSGFAYVHFGKIASRRYNQRTPSDTLPEELITRGIDLYLMGHGPLTIVTLGVPARSHLSLHSFD